MYYSIYYLSNEKYMLIFLIVTEETPYTTANFSRQTFNSSE